MDARALHKLSYGMYVVGSRSEGRLNAQVANTAFQVTSEPPTIAVSINRQNFTHQFIKASHVFTISVLDLETPMTFIGKFGFKSGRDIDKFADTKYRVGQTGAPIIEEHSVGYLEAEVTNQIDVGTHTIFVGRIVDAGVTGDTQPMTYAFYHEVKKGFSPKTAPTYIKELKEKEIHKDV